jgi:PAS domain S-box-containing protein
MAAPNTHHSERRAVWTAALFGISLTVLAFLLARNWDAQQRESAFEAIAREYLAALNLNVEKNVGNVWALAALYTASEHVSRDEFALFARAALANSPGLIAAEWAPRIEHARRSAFEAEQRVAFPDFHITMLGADRSTLLPASARDEYVPVTYVEPLAGNERALGLDLASSPERLAAIEASCASGEIAASEPLIPIPEREGRYGFLVFHPLHAPGVSPESGRHCTGFVVGIFRIATVIDQALGALTARPVTLRVYDREPTRPGARLLHHREGTGEAFGEAPRRLHPLHVAGRQWWVEFSSLVPPYHAPSYWLAWGVLLAGSIITAILSAYARQAAGRAGKIEAEVKIRTADLMQSRESLARALQAHRFSESRQRAILDTVLDGIVTADQRGIIQSLNPATERIFGYTADEMVGHNLKMLMPEPYHSHHDGYIQNYLRTGERKVIGFRREVEGLRKNGEAFPLELAVCDLQHEGSEHLFIGIVRDIGERKQVERMKSEFISTVSHELRTPLTAIRGALGLLAGGAMGTLAEPVQKLIGIANGNCERLVRLINDILDMEKMEAGKASFQLAPLELMRLLRQSIEANQAYAQQLGVHLTLTDEIAEGWVLADSDRFMQVMTNLLSNAAKFSPAGAEVTVGVRCENGGFRITVADRGPGIPVSFRPHLFDKFAQADSTDRRQKGGTGLGLAICKAIVERLGGRLNFDSEIGVGTRFHVDLPAMASPEAVNEAPGDGSGRPRILVVEDDPDVGRLLCLMLEKQGYVADIAANAEVAKALLDSGRYAAVTLDLLLPGQSGQSLLKDLRRHADLADLPVVVVSAVADQTRQTVNGEAVAVVDWLSKPIDEARLSLAVRSALRRGATRKPLILHVEDDPDVVHVVNAMLARHAEIRPAFSLAEARAELAEHTFDLAIVDIGLPDGSGLDLLKELSDQKPQVPVVIFSAMEIEDEALRKRAHAYLLKSRTENLKLVETIRGLLANETRTQEP